MYIFCSLFQSVGLRPYTHVHTIYNATVYATAYAASPHPILSTGCIYELGPDQPDNLLEIGQLQN